MNLYSKNITDQQAEYVQKVQDLSSLSVFVEPTCPAVIWTRQVPPETQSWINQLNPKLLPNCRKLLRTSDARKTIKEIFENKTFDEAKVFEKFGVKPNQIRDMLALVGDTSDNIPGVPKVGQKTAAKWLNEHGNIDGIKANAESFGGVVGNNLREFLPNLDRNVELVSLKGDLDLKIDFESLLVLNNDDEALEKLYTEFEFKPLKNSPIKKTAEEVAGVNSKYETVDTN